MKSPEEVQAMYARMERLHERAIAFHTPDLLDLPVSALDLIKIITLVEHTIEGLQKYCPPIAWAVNDERHVDAEGKDKSGELCSLDDWMAKEEERIAKCETLITAARNAVKEAKK